jgi:hypothetical protein
LARLPSASAGKAKLGSETCTPPRLLAAEICSGYLYETTFEKEVFSDLTGERGVLMGAIQVG